MKNTPMGTPVTVLLSLAVRERSLAPNSSAQGTAVPAAGRSTATATATCAGTATVLGGHVLDLPGLPRRAAPV